MSARIFIADLAAYNSGELAGKWVDLEGMNAGDVEETIADVLCEGTGLLKALGEWAGVDHEEFFITDYEGFGPIRIGEYDSIESIIEHVERMGDDPERYFAYVEYNGEDYAEHYDPDNVIGPWDSMKDVAYESVESFILHEIPEGMRRTVENYFDYDAFARDLRIEGRFTEYEGKIYEIID